MGCFFPYLFISPLEGDFFIAAKFLRRGAGLQQRAPLCCAAAMGQVFSAPQCWGSGWATALSGSVGAIWGSLWAVCSWGCGSTKLGKGNFANKTHAMHAGGLQLPLLEMHQPRAVTASACLGSKALGCRSPPRDRLPGSGAVCPVAMQLGTHPSACEDLWSLQDVVSLSSVLLQLSWCWCSPSRYGSCRDAWKELREGAAEVKPRTAGPCLWDTVHPPGTGAGFAAGALRGAREFLIKNLISPAQLNPHPVLSGGLRGWRCRWLGGMATARGGQDATVQDWHRVLGCWGPAGQGHSLGAKRCRWPPWFSLSRGCSSPSPHFCSSWHSLDRSGARFD